jgi:hypothetical protein
MQIAMEVKSSSGRRCSLNDMKLPVEQYKPKHVSEAERLAASKAAWAVRLNQPMPDR